MFVSGRMPTLDVDGCCTDEDDELSMSSDDECLQPITMYTHTPISNDERNRESRQIIILSNPRDFKIECPRPTDILHRAGCIEPLLSLFSFMLSRGATQNFNTST